MFRITHALNLIPYDGFVEHSAVISMSVQALLSALAMALRIKCIARERDFARTEEQIARRLADIDPLTGLLNRRALLSRALHGQQFRPLTPIAGTMRLLLVDIDFFKRVNDNHGHERGDTALREMGALLAQLSSQFGLVGRLGGEEFVILGPSTQLPAALALTILDGVRQTRFAGHLQMTVSIGIAEGPMRNEEEWTGLYRQADAALYEAKTAGRNRAVDGTAIVPRRAGEPANNGRLTLIRRA